MWSPLAFATVLILLSPSKEEEEERKREEVALAVDRARKEVMSRIPVTPPESAEWMGLMLGELWAPFMGPLMMKENLGAWQVWDIVWNSLCSWLAAHHSFAICPRM